MIAVKFRSVETIWLAGYKESMLFLYIKVAWDK